MKDTTKAQFQKVAKELYKKNIDLVNVNKELALLQKLYEIIMHSIEAEEVAQRFIDVVIKDLGFVAGLVALRNPLNSHLQIVAVSQSKETKQALTLLKEPLHTMQVSVHNRSNLLVRSYHLRRKIITHKLESITTPFIDPELTQKVSGIIGIKSIIIFPLVFGNKKLGVFTISLARKVKDLTEYEKEVLKRVTTVFGVAVDRVMLYLDLKKVNNKLKELDKRKNEFLNVAAHELRAPLTAVKGYLSMLMEEKAGGVSLEFKEFLDGALEGAEREIRLVNNLLNVSRIEEGRLVFEMGKINLSQVVSTVYDEFKADAEKKKLEFKLDIADQLRDQVYVDQDRIHEVVANLVSNAIKYTDQGSVVVKLYNPGNEKNQSVSSMKAETGASTSRSNNIRLEVGDSGYGLDKDEINKLFTKFYRAESSAGKQLGTGLGLYITKLLIEKFGGRLGVDSDKGKGSTFWFELPVE